MGPGTFFYAAFNIGFMTLLLVAVIAVLYVLLKDLVKDLLSQMTDPSVEDAVPNNVVALPQFPELNYAELDDQQDAVKSGRKVA